MKRPEEREMRRNNAINSGNYVLIVTHKGRTSTLIKAKFKLSIIPKWPGISDKMIPMILV